MDKKEIVKNLEKEFLEEINNFDVKISDLEKCGVSRKVFAIEDFLHECYGDEILKNKLDDSVQGSSNIEKLSESEIDEDKIYRNICNDIENSEFDKNIDIIIKK